jgi:hypothetical protein
MSKLMDELMAEVTRVNALNTEVERTVAVQTAEIEADRKVRMERPRAFLIKMGWLLDNVRESDARGYFPNIPLGVTHKGYPLFINYSSEKSYGEKRLLHAYGGCRGQIQFRVGPQTIRPDYEENRGFVNAIIDQWDDEHEAQFEKCVSEIVKARLAEKMEAMQKKLAQSNDEHEKYFGKGE